MSKMRICIKCDKEVTCPGQYCNICRHKKLGRKCQTCEVDISDSATYCSIHSQSHRPSGNGYKVHAAKIRNGTYPPIGREITNSKGYVMVKISHVIAVITDCTEWEITKLSIAF